MDSVVLLELLARLSATLGLRLSAIHVHHGLSPNADQWMAFCESVCNAKSIPLMIDRVRVDRALAGGVEAIARDVRYSAFNRVDADLLALAQHADDQAETVMLQILRGTGLKGMAGMGETRTLRDGLILIRPLLGFPRTAIEAYADRNRLKWIEDESNRDTVHTRNFIRQVLAPKLAERFPHYRESLARAGRHASEADEMLSALAAIDLQWDGRNACADALDGLPLTRQVNALYHWLQWLQWPGDPSNIFPSQAQLVEWAMQLFRPAPPDRPHQAAGHDLVIYRRKNLLQLERK
jgi:tRNA(Ile)-lysidine synthase